MRVLVRYAGAPTPAERAALEALGAVVLREIRVVPLLVAVVPASRLAEAAAAPGVVAVEEDVPLVPLLDESRALVGAEAARRAHGATGRGVTIAVLDTGVDASHPDLADRVVASYDATLPPSLPRRLLGLTTPVLPAYVDGHGTHVAGIAAGSGAESGGRYAGVAPEAGIANVKVFDENGESSASNVLAGIDWVLARRDDLGIRVMQMSLGGKPTDGADALSDAVDVASDYGVLTVAAAGNSGPDAGTVGVPGVAARALTVGAVDKSLEAAPFSARGPTPDGRQKPDVVAPGVAVRSALPLATSRGAYYGSATGTSMAAPHVAGAAALVFEANVSLPPAMAKWILVATSRPVGPTPHAWDPAYGWGLLDAEAAVRAAKDPSVLGAPPFDETARRVPFDGPVSPIAKLEYEAGRAQRSTPAPAPLALVAAAAAAALAAARAGVPRRGAREEP